MFLWPSSTERFNCVEIECYFRPFLLNLELSFYRLGIFRGVVCHFLNCESSPTKLLFIYYEKI
jgi:hypothetical protein